MVYAVKRMRSFAPLNRPMRKEIAAELQVSEWSPIFTEPRVATFLAAAQLRVARLRKALKVWETCNAMRLAAREVISCGESFTPRTVRSRFLALGIKDGAMRAPFAQKFFLRLRTAVHCGDLKIMRERPPPKILEPLLLLRE